MEENEQSSLLSRVPPHDIAAETAVLSSMLFDSEAIPTAMEILRPQDFYRPDFRLIYEAINELFSRNTPVDLIMLKNKLEAMGVFEQVGGLQTLNMIAGNVSTSAHIRHYANIVAEKAMLRALIKASSEISAMSFEAREKSDAVIDFAEKAIFDIARKRNASDFVPIQEVLVDTIANIEHIYKSGNKITGVKTGFTDFDRKTAGLQPSDLILIAARPSMGKTTFALNIAQYAAFRSQVPTAIFSLEMSKEQIVSRLLSAEAMVDSQRLRTGALEPDDFMKIADSLGHMSGAPLYIDDTPGITVSEIRAKCRKLKLEKGLGLIIIDYLQLMSGSGRTESRQQEVSEISRSLKALAREMEAPVVTASQLSRAVEQRADHIPMLSDLRESGSIEQDADIVCFIYRDEYYDKQTEKKGVAEIIIAKQRNGPTGTVELDYLGNYTRFVNRENQYT